MISSGAYNYINVLEKVADASWLRHSVISNNIANADTPTFKRKDVNFQSYLEEQLSGGDSLDDEVADAEIFPFLIQVYVENAAKQALMADEKMLISVTVYPEDRDDEKYVNIFISDTGKGFPDEILCKLQNGQNISDNGKHIGIWNCMRRFQYYYGDQGEIHFSNSPLGGAVVDIHVPYKIGRSDTQE